MDTPCGRVLLSAAHHDSAGLGADDLVHHLLVEHAALAVEAHHLRLESVRLHLGLVMLHHVLHHGPHPLRVFHQHCHLGRQLRQIIAILLAHVVRDLLVGLIDGRLVDLQFHRWSLKVQRQRGLVPDAVLEGIAAQVALGILIRSKGPERVFVSPVDRRAGQTKEKGIGQSLAHLPSIVPFLRAVRLIHHYNDVFAVVPLPFRLAEFVDRGDQHLPHVLIDQLLQFLSVRHPDHVRHVRCVEGRTDLRVQVDPVHHDQHRRIAQPRVRAELLRGENHQQALAAALEMPDQALLRIASHHTSDHLVRRLVLLVAADHLDPPVLLVRGEEGEVLQDVQHHAWPHQALHCHADMAQIALLLMLLIAPRPPKVDRHADAAVAQQPAFRGKGEHVRHKHGRDLLLVDLVHLIRAVEPRHRAARRRLRLADHQRKPFTRKTTSKRFTTLPFW